MDRTIGLEKVSEVLKAMAHPVRLQILEGLIENECNVNKIQQKLGLPQSTISQHLKTLKNAGIIKGRREKTKICYSILNKRVVEIIYLIKKDDFF
jgi:ArsR family transcriptional regulator